MATMTLKLWDIDDFFSHEFPQSYRLVDPIMPDTGDMLLHAKRGAGKTLVAWDLAIAVATGGYFLGHFKCRKAKVAMIQVDMPDKQTHERLLHSVAQAGGTGIKLVTTDGAPTMLALDENGKFRKKPEEAIIALAKLEPDLVIFDTLRKVHKLKENESDTPSYVYGAGAQLFPRAARVWCHHDSKTYKISTGYGAVSARDPDENFRGSGAWLDDATIGITLQAKGRGSNWKGLVGWTKLRSKWPDPVLMELDPNTMLIRPAEMSPTQKGQRYIDMNPEATNTELAAFLQGSVDTEGNPLVQRSRAFEIAAEIINE